MIAARPLTTADVERRRRRFANVTLRTHEGRAVRFYDDLLKDKAVIVQFLYTQCTLRCPKTTVMLREVQHLLGGRLGRDIFMYSITVDPEHDTPAALRAYAREMRAKAGWVFLTGEPADVEQVRRNFGDDPSLRFDNSNHLNLIAYGVEALERWGSLPAWTEPATMVKLVTSIVPPRS
jgi:protein SCO1/2